MTSSPIDRVVIVGAGISGLSAGILLASLGRRVTVVDQHALPGGYLQSFSRRGTRFEVGFHQMGASQPGEIFARYLKVLGVYDDLTFLPHRDDALFQVALAEGQRIDIPRGADRIADAMKRCSPRDAAGIDRVLAEIGACVGASPWLNLGRDTIDLEVYRKAMETSVRDVVEPLIAAQKVRETFYSFNFNSTLPPTACPFGMYAFMFHILTASCARVQGGGDALIGALVRRFRALGGTLLTGRSAERLRVEDRFAKALELSDGTPLELDILISTCHPLETIRFCGREHFSPGFLETLDALEPGRGSFKVYAELDRPVEALQKNPAFILDPAPPWQPGLYVVSPSGLDPTYNGRHTVEILFWQDFREVEAWKDSRFGRRPPEYAAFKERLADAAIDRVERELPGIRGHVRHRYASTSLTNLHYTRSAQGASMGIRQDIRYHTDHHLRPRNRLRNVFLAGQSLGTPGITGCVITSTMLCDAILPEAGLLRRLREVTF
jgi:all-trans-retinol 13,14-reductase